MPPRISPQIVTQASLDAGESSCFADFAHFPDAAPGNTEPSTRSRQSFANNNHHHSNDAQPSITPRSITSLRSSAFEVYRKPTVNQGGLYCYETNSKIRNFSTIATSPEPYQHVSVSHNTLDFEKRVSAINESLRYVSYKQSERNVSEVMLHLREQNQLLLRICSDLTDELAIVHRKREELKVQLEGIQMTKAAAVPPTTNNASLHHSIV